MTPKDAREFRKACNTLRKCIGNDTKLREMFETIVTGVVLKTLKDGV